MATVTYVLRSANSDLVGGADFNKKLLVGTEAESQIIVSVAGSATEVSRGFTEPGVPGSSGLQGKFTIEMNVSALNESIKLSAQVHRVSSTGTVLASSSITAEQDATVQLHTFNIASAGLGTWGATDRLRVDYRFRNSSPTSGTTAILIGTTNAEVISAPLSATANQATETDVAQPVGIIGPVPSSKTKTYVERSTFSDLDVGGAAARQLLVGIEASEKEIQLVFVGAPVTRFLYFFTDPAEPSSAGLNTNKTVEIKIRSGGAAPPGTMNLSAGVHRVNSSGVVQVSSPFATEQDCSVGVHSFSITTNLGTWGIGDRLRVDLRFRQLITYVLSVTVRVGVGLGDSEVICFAFTNIIGQVTEVGTSQSMTEKKRKLLGQPAEADLSQATAHTKKKTLGLPNEANTAQATVADKLRLLGQPTEIDTVFVAGPAKGRVLGQVFELDEAQIVLWNPKIRIVDRPTLSEFDISNAVAWAPKHRLVGRPVPEFDIPRSIDVIANRLVAAAEEADEALEAAPGRVFGVDFASEVDEAQDVRAAHSAIVAQVLELDEVFGAASLKTALLGQVFELDEAQDVRAARVYFVVEVEEFDSALGAVPIMFFSSVLYVIFLARRTSIILPGGRSALWLPEHARSGHTINLPGRELGMSQPGRVVTISLPPRDTLMASVLRVRRIGG